MAAVIFYFNRLPPQPDPLSSSCSSRASRIFYFGLRLFGALALFCLTAASNTRAASFLFDAAHAETAGNADWVIDEDSGAQRFPTPDQSTVTASTTETYWK